MGVMLSLDRNGPASNHRRARHARRPGGQARTQALAVSRRGQPSASGRLLSRLTRSVLTRTVLTRRNRSYRDAAAPPAPPATAVPAATPATGSAGGPAAGQAPAA
jgi:hypothetical protein